MRLTRLFVNGVDVSLDVGTIVGDTIMLSSGIDQITKQSCVVGKLYVQTS